MTLLDWLEKADTCKEKISSARSLAKEELKTREGADGGDAAYDYMLEQAMQPDLNITEDTILSLHRLLYQDIDAEQAGRYRSFQVSIPGTEYVPPAPGEVPRLMEHLTLQIHYSRFTLHPIELAAMAYKRLLDIYPFSVGNERTALFLMNLILIHAGYGAIFFPPSWQDDYDNALAASRRTNDMRPFSKLVAELVLLAE